MKSGAEKYKDWYIEFVESLKLHIADERVLIFKFEEGCKLCRKEEREKIIETVGGRR